MEKQEALSDDTVNESRALFKAVWDALAEGMQCESQLYRTHYLTLGYQHKFRRVTANSDSHCQKLGSYWLPSGARFPPRYRSPLPL